MKVLICGGGTGGHIYPALSVVSSLQEMGLTAENFLWIGTRGEIEERLVPQAGLRLETISGGAIAGVPGQVRLINAIKLTWSIVAASKLLVRFKPDVLLMTGGYVNFPVALAAWLQHVPSLIYLPDIAPGMAIRTLSRLVRLVACTTDESFAYFKRAKVVVTGYPVRQEVRAAAAIDKVDALKFFDLQPGRPTLFVFGGSRGARSINKALMASLPALLQELQIIHVSGTLDWQEVEENATDLPEHQRSFYRPYAYLYDGMGPAFRAADLVLARAGASMLGEGPAFGLPSILVPYPYAWRYQKINADYLAERDAAIRLDDADLGEELAPTVLSLLKDPTRLARMGKAAKMLDEPAAASNIARVLMDIKKRAKT